VIRWAMVGLCVGFVAMADAHPVLTFAEQIVTQAPAKGATGPKAGTEQFPVTVTLGRKYLSVDAQGSRQIYDFERRRIYHVNVKDKTYEETSLYSVLGYRAMELQNRLYINSVLGEAKVATDAQAPALSEHLLSLLAPDENTVIETGDANGTTTYRWKDKELLSVSDKTRPLTNGYQGDYWRYLRYTIGGHPKIYADLDKRTGVPEVLKTLRPEAGQKHITLRLTGLTNPPDAPYSLDGFTRAPPKREPYVALQKIGADGASSFAARAETAKRDRDAAAAAGKMLDAALAHFTYALTTGDSGRDWLMQMRDQVQGDADANALASALSVKNADEANKAIQTLSALRAKSKSPYAYLLDVFVANHQMSLRHTTEARQLFLKALTANPYLTGAWFDLGKLYYSTFETEAAWACWDAARALSPGHPFGKNIETMEREMVSDHPELF
jgi:tetratricopeptide (TPR) repeat protein